MDISIFSLMGVDLWLIGVVFLAIIGIWIYLSLAIRKSAEKLGVEKNWANIVWFGCTIPYLMANMVRKPWWPTIVLPILIGIFSIFAILGNIVIVISIIFTLAFIGYSIFLKWHICELRFIHGWWALLTPSLIVLGIVLSLISSSLSVVGIILTGVGIIWYLILWGILAWSE